MGADWDFMRLRAFAALAVFPGVVIGFATPAQADGFSGTYTRTGSGEGSTWVVTPCGPGCAHVADSDGWNADAHLVRGLWTLTVDLPRATICNNDGTAPGTLKYEVDLPRQEGTVINIHPAPCQLAPGYSNSVYFTLTRA
jgi:hypothetical protein